MVEKQHFGTDSALVQPTKVDDCKNTGRQNRLFLKMKAEAGETKKCFYSFLFYFSSVISTFTSQRTVSFSWTRFTHQKPSPLTSAVTELVFFLLFKFFLLLKHMHVWPTLEIKRMSEWHRDHCYH